MSLKENVYIAAFKKRRVFYKLIYVGIVNWLFTMSLKLFFNTKAETIAGDSWTEPSV